jgi:hypothetical protein
LSNDLLTAAALAWLAAALISLTGRGMMAARGLLFLGSAGGILAALLALPDGTAAVLLPTEFAGERVHFQMSPDALWLLACWQRRHGRARPAGCSAPP